MRNCVCPEYLYEASCQSIPNNSYNHISDPLLAAPGISQSPTVSCCTGICAAIQVLSVSGCCCANVQHALNLCQSQATGNCATVLRVAVSLCGHVSTPTIITMLQEAANACGCNCASQVNYF